MTTLLLSTTDKQLQMLKDKQDKFGADARKEIQRRKMIGYSDGTYKRVVVQREDNESELGTSPERTYATKVLERMRGGKR